MQNAHTYTCTSIHALSVLKLTGTLHPACPAMALHSALTLPHIVCASHKCEDKTRRQTHSTFKCSLSLEREIILCNKKHKMWPSLLKARSHVTRTYQLLHCGTNDMCQVYVKDRTKETTFFLKYDWLQQLNLTRWNSKLVLRGFRLEACSQRKPMPKCLERIFNLSLPKCYD